MTTPMLFGYIPFVPGDPRIQQGVFDECIDNIRPFRIEICECYDADAVHELHIILVELDVKIENPIDGGGAKYIAARIFGDVDDYRYLR